MNAFRRRRKEKKEEEKKSNTHTLNADYVVCVMPTYFSNFRPVINPSRTSNCNNPHTKGRPCSKSIGSSDHREEVSAGSTNILACVSKSCVPRAAFIWLGPVSRCYQTDFVKYPRWQCSGRSDGQHCTCRCGEV